MSYYPIPSNPNAEGTSPTGPRGERVGFYNPNDPWSTPAPTYTPQIELPPFNNSSYMSSSSLSSSSSYNGSSSDLNYSGPINPANQLQPISYPPSPRSSSAYPPPPPAPKINGINGSSNQYLNNHEEGNHPPLGNNGGHNGGQPTATPLLTKNEQQRNGGESYYTPAPYYSPQTSSYQQPMYYPGDGGSYHPHHAMGHYQQQQPPLYHSQYPGAVGETYCYKNSQSPPPKDKFEHTLHSLPSHPTSSSDNSGSPYDHPPQQYNHSNNNGPAPPNNSSPPVSASAPPQQQQQHPTSTSHPPKNKSNSKEGTPSPHKEPPLSHPPGKMMGKGGGAKGRKGNNNNNNNNNKEQSSPPPPLVVPTIPAGKVKKKRKKRTKEPQQHPPPPLPQLSSTHPHHFKEEGGGKKKKSPSPSNNTNTNSSSDDFLLQGEHEGSGLAGCTAAAAAFGDDEGMMKVGGNSNNNSEIPMVECGCFPADEVHAEPGPFYTHLGAAHNLAELRKLVEGRSGFRGNQVRLEKVVYTGKEGKTGVGCPLAKWILRRGSYEEQLLFLVKQRRGHKCSTAWIVVCVVIWEGVPPHFADNLYDTVVYKLNRFGIPTTRRSDTNEQRSCACQGVDPDSCGAAYSFGCAWSMFFNGCKYARSRNVRKFRLTEEHEESELEEKVQHLATHLAPLYERVAPESYSNQIDHENEGLECRLGYRPGRPFSGVTATLDYCSHAHKDAHNMMNGSTVTVSLTRNRTIGKGDDEQYHVLPLYKLDDTDEHGSKEGQKAKVKKGQLEILKKFPCKVRIRKVPLLPSRRRAKAKSSTAKNEQSTTPPNPQIGVQKVGGQGGDYSSSQDILPPKREKLFDDRLTNGTNSVVGEYGDSSSSTIGRWNNQQQGPPGTNSFGDVASTPLWNHHFSTASTPPPRSSYFDHPPSSQFPPSGASSSLTSLTELTNSTISRHTGSTSSSSSNASTTLLNSPGGGSAGSSSGYSSMSPILPSFRNTFMPEDAVAPSSNSEGGNAVPQSPHRITSMKSEYHSPYQGGAATGVGGLYHPQPHNPCLPPPPPIYSQYSEGPSHHFSQGSFWPPQVPSPYNPYHHHGAQYPGPPPPGMGGYGPHQGYYAAAAAARAAPTSYHHHPFSPTPVVAPPPPPPSCFVSPPKPKIIPEVNESSSDNEDCFKDGQMGGVAIALTHGSVILQCAKHEMHATTALKSPNRMYPSRICLIFYQHKSMNNRFHGWSEWEKKIEAKKLQEVKLINQGKLEASPRKMKQLIKEGYIQDTQ